MINTERKILLKQRREKALQNAKDRKIGKANAQTALQASTRANKASKDTHEITMTDEKDTHDITMTDEKDTHDITMTDEKDTHDITMTDDATTGTDSTVDVHLLPHSSAKAKHPSQLKRSSKNRTETTEPSVGDPLTGSHATVKVNGHMPDPGDIGRYEFLIEGGPNPPDLEGIEDDQLLQIQRNIQDKLKQRDEERERNITKRMKQYKEKYDFINKALLESIAHITEMTQTDPSYSFSQGQIS